MQKLSKKSKNNIIKVYKDKKQIIFMSFCE